MLKTIVKAYAQIRQWHTTRKIIVFESDDWGSIHTPDKETYQKLSSKSLSFSKDYYSKFDTLAGVKDFEMLYEILERYTDLNNNHPVITANAIMANPNFKTIKESDFTEYHSEPFYKTILSLPDGEQILKLWNYGIQNKIFHPQLHGREHLLVQAWLYELKSGNKALCEAFEEGVFSVPFTSQFYTKRKNLQAAFDYSGIADEDLFQENSIIESAAIFKNYFGFASKSFIAPAYIWNRKIEQTLQKAGVQYIQGLPIQYEPIQESNHYNKRFHYTGEKNKYGQVYLARNVFFEPSSNQDFNWFHECINRIENAFQHKSPVIIGMHRVNFIGSIVPTNREKNLELFDRLLKAITRKWPDVEFLSTDQLGDLIKEKHN